MLIDTHCHLNFQAFEKILPDVLRRANESGVGQLIVPGAKIDSSQKAVEIANTYPNCFSAVGIHPHHSMDYQKLGELEVYKQLSVLVQNPKVKAVGEIGLDYYSYRNSPIITAETKENQKCLFLFQLELASQNKLPVIFHCRNAFSDQLDIIKNFLTRKGKVSGVFHCFGGSINDLQEVLKIGMYIGFDGNITYPGNESLLTVLKETPFDRMLLETDSPYLTPEPFRGKTNEPSNLIYTAKFISNKLNIPLNALIKQTSSNAVKLFNLK
jgi:TatD DNase family protein